MTCLPVEGETEKARKEARADEARGMVENGQNDLSGHLPTCLETKLGQTEKQADFSDLLLTQNEAENAPFAQSCFSTCRSLSPRGNGEQF